MALECVIGAAVQVPTLDKDLVRLQQRISATRSALVKYEKALARVAEIVLSGRTLTRDVKSDIDIAEQYVRSANPMGQILLSKIEGIRLQVDAAISEAEPDLLSVDKAMRDALLAEAQAWGTTAKLELETKKSDSSAARGFRAPLSDQQNKDYSEFLDAESDLIGEHRQLVELFNSVNIRVVSFPPNIFSGCAFNPTAPGEAMIVSPDSFEMGPGQSAVLTAVVSGGSGNYELREDTVPAALKGKVAFGDILPGGGRQIRIDIASSDALRTGKYVLVIADKQGDRHRREIVVGIGSKRSSANSGTSNNGPGLIPVPADPTVKRMQSYLSGQSRVGGDKSYDPQRLDGQMGPNTRAAMISYISDNYPNDITVSGKAQLQGIGINSKTDLLTIYRKKPSRVDELDGVLLKLFIDEFDPPAL